MEHGENSCILLTSMYVKLVETSYQYETMATIRRTYDERLQLFHLEDILLLPGELLAVANLFLGVIEMFAFRYPFSVDTTQAAHLPPSFPTDNSVELFRTEPIDQ